MIRKSQGFMTEVDAKAYADLQEQLKRQGNWLLLPRAALRSLSLQQAGVLFHLLGVGRKAADRKGWLMCTDQFLHNGLGLDADRQDAIFAVLRRKGLVEVQHREGVRYVRVCLEAVRQLLLQGVED